MSLRRRARGVRLVLALCMAVSAFPSARAAEGDRVVAVDLRLPQGVDRAAIEPLLAVVPGEPLSRAAVRRTVRLLYETGRFEQVRAHLKADPAGWLVTFATDPRKRLGRVEWVGVGALDTGRLQQEAGLVPDMDWRPEVARRAVEVAQEAYARRGWQAARVVATSEPGQAGRVDLRLTVEEGTRSRVDAVVFEGVTGLPEGQLADALGVGRGAPLDLEAVERGLPEVRRRLREAGRLRAEVGPPHVESIPDRPGWGRVVVPVRAGARIHLGVWGNHLFSDAEVIEALELPSDAPLTPAVLQEGVARARRRYQLLGRHGARVRFAEREVGEGERLIWISVDESVPMQVARVRFDGATRPDRERFRERLCERMKEAMPRVRPRPGPDLLEALGDRRVRGDRPGPTPVVLPDPCTVYAEDVWAEVAREVEALYRSEGWLEARVSPPRLTVSGDGRTGWVDFEVQEGVQTRLESVVLEGAPALPEASLRRRLPLSPGSPLSILAVQEGRLALRAAHAERGYPFVTVRDRLVLSEDRTRARVFYDVDPGPLVRVGQIIIRGHRNTPSSLVRARLAFDTGDPWDLERVRQSQQRILSLGVYRSAVVRLVEPDQPAEVMDVLVSVTERSPKSAELGFGLSNQDGPRVFAEYADLAFGGEMELHLRGKVNDPIFASGQFFKVVREPFAPDDLEWETLVGLRLPRLGNARTDLVWERDNRTVSSGSDVVQIYRLTRLAASVGTDRRLTERITATLKLELEFDDLMRGDTSGRDLVLTQLDRERLRLEDGQWLVGSVRPGLVVDLRDDPLRPRRGWLLTGALDWSQDLGIRVEPMHFLKAVMSATRYQPGPGRVTFAVSAQGGVIAPLIPDNHTIGPKRFFLGGADSLRGFPVDAVYPEDQREVLHADAVFCERVLDATLCTPDAAQVTRGGKRPTGAGGEAYLLVKGEVRFPLVGNLQGGLFMDIGNLWSDPAEVEPFDLRPTAGGGLRYDTPVGPIALDVGFNLLPDRVLREAPYAVHFAIGLF